MTCREDCEHTIDDTMGSLMRETLRLFRERRESLSLIHERTGIPYYWLRKFIGGEVRDPGVNRTQRLYEYLSGSSLIKALNAP